VSETVPNLPREEAITSGRVSLNARVLGGGRNLVALHGGPGLDHHILIPLARRLAAGYRVLLPDLPGHGASRSPAGRVYGLRGIEDRLASFLAALDGGVDVLVGHSMGAMIARALVRQKLVHPRALVLLSPPAADQPEERSALRRAVSLIEGAIPATRDPRADLEAHLAAECASLDEEALDCVRRARLHATSDYRALLRNVHRANRGPRRAFDPGCPVLVVVGENDRTTPVAQAERVAASMSGAVVNVIEDTGHYPFFDRPDETAAAILEFLNAID